MLINEPMTLEFTFKQPQETYSVWLNGKPFVKRVINGTVTADSLSLPMIGNYEFSNMSNVATVKAAPLVRKQINLPPYERAGAKSLLKKYDPTLNEIALTDQIRGVVYFGKKFDGLPICAKAFVEAHEEGHQYYDSEEGADLYAFNKLLKKGFSPYQCVSSLGEYLTPHADNVKRVDELKKMALKIG